MKPSPRAPWGRLTAFPVGDVPDVTGLRRTRIVHDDGTAYLDRYHIVDTASTSIRIHHWRSSDSDRAPHDHPWPNTTLVLDGCLREHSFGGAEDLTPGALVVREAADPHRVELLSDEAWTLFVTGPIVRRWGFHTPAGWVYWADWPHAGRYES